MAGFKDPSFQDRQNAAANAKRKALEQLKARPPIDEAAAAAQREAAEKRDAALAEQRAAAAKARADEKAAKAAAKAAKLAEEEAARALKAVRLKPPSAAEMKAARDARYAARKARNS